MAETAIQQKKTSSSSPMPNSNSTANNANGGDLFSPTSAAAWALSTLHNFGAAAPSDNGPRPTTDSLTGTRLFNNAGVISTDLNRTSVTTSDRTQTTQNVHCGVSIAQTQVTTGVKWQPQFQHHSSVSVCGCSYKLLPY